LWNTFLYYKSVEEFKAFTVYEYIPLFSLWKVSTNMFDLKHAEHASCASKKSAHKYVKYFVLGTLVETLWKKMKGDLLCKFWYTISPDKYINICFAKLHKYK